LTATTIGVSVVPLSGVVEVAGTWHTLRYLLADLGHRYLALRLGIANPEQHWPSPRTPRLPVAQMVDASAVPSASSDTTRTVGHHHSPTSDPSAAARFRT
jgi:hypothetical protein